MGRVPPGEPSNRWPWLAIAAGVVVIVVAVVAFYANRPSSVNIALEGTLTPNPVARASSPSAAPPPTLVPPTQPPSASLAPSPTPLPTPTPAPTPSPPPTPPPTPTPLPPSPPPAVAAQPPAGQPTAPGAAPAGQAAPAAQPTAPAQNAPAVQPTASGQNAPAAPSAPAPPPTPAASPSPTPFAGQVSAGGGLGNTRTDIDAAYGAPVGETANHLVVFRKNNLEDHIGLAPDLNGRAALIVQLPIQSSQPPTLEQAQAQAHRLLPTDAQPPNATPEGNNQFVVERYTSQKLGQALPPELFSPGGGQPGSFMIVYVKDQSGRISRWILGPGNDPNALIAEGA